MIQVWAIAALLGTADAQERGVDPKYLAYLEAIERLIQPGDVSPEAPVQLWDGQLSVSTDPAAGASGIVLVGGGGDFQVFPAKQEKWFFLEVPDPTAGFRVVHEGGGAFGNGLAALDAFDTDWESLPCDDMWVQYANMPGPPLIQDLDYDAGIVRTHFDMFQRDDTDQLVLRGSLLREWHASVDDVPEDLIDHWAFHADYDMVDEVGEELVLIPSNVQFVSTTSFFAHLHVLQQNDPGLYSKYAQVQYERTTGAFCW